MVENKTKTPETFAERLAHLMSEHDPPLGINELAATISTSYEHARRMVRGILVPSKFVIRAIAQEFGADAEELEALAKGDKFRREFGEGAPTPIFNSEIAPFAQSWHLLSDAQRMDLLRRLKTFLSENVKIAQHNHKHPGGGR